MAFASREETPAAQIPSVGGNTLFKSLPRYTASIRSATARKQLTILLLSIAALLSIAGYFSPHIWLHGEAREALVIQDIVENHHWILPLRNSALPSKPILYHWIAASFGSLFGVSDFSIRLPSMIAATVMVWVTFCLGRVSTDGKAALLAVGILASTYQFWDAGTSARVDMVFATLIGVTLAAWYLWYGFGGKIARATTYLAIALAVLTKGPAGIVLPALTIGCFLLIERDFKRLLAFFSWPWIVFVLVIDLGWYAAAYHYGGANFWYKQIVHENIQRFLGAGEFHTQKSRFSQAGWLVTHLFPWSLVLIWTLIRWVRQRREDSLGRFLHAWWLTIFGFFLFARGQRAVYLLPIYPAVALLAAREVIRLFDAQQPLKSRTWAMDWRQASAIALVAVDVSLALSIPIGRTVREDTSAQEEFVEEAVVTIPRTATVYAAADFPETALIVLAYRLDRNIVRRMPDCYGDYYYLNLGAKLPSCGSPSLTTRDRSLSLFHLSKPVH